MTPPLLRARDVTLTLRVGDEDRPILRGVSLDIPAGATVGLVGESGSGKSMFARTVLRTLPAGARWGGRIEMEGTSLLDADAASLRSLRARRVAMVFQDPRAHVNPVRTIGDHLTEVMRFVGGQRPRQARDRAVELLEAVRLDGARALLDRYPHQLSGGMLQRVMIAGALAGDPALLLADEPTTALDTTTQLEVMALLADLREERELAVLLITHDLELAAAACDRTVVMYAGRTVEEQPSADLHRHPRHPYSVGLLASRPGLGGATGRLETIPGRPIPAYETPPGCAFAPRCRYAADVCRAEDPELRRIGPALAACHRSEAIDASLVELAREAAGA